MHVSTRKCRNNAITLVTAVALGALMAACSSQAPASAPGSTSGSTGAVSAVASHSAAASSTSETSSGAPSSASSGGSSATVAGAPANSAELKKAVQGQSLNMAIVGHPNAVMTNLWKTIDILKSDYGVTATLKYMDSTPMTAALLSNAIEVGVVSFASVAAAVDSGANLQVIAGEYQNNLDAAVAAKPATSLKDLKGKPFGVSQSLSSVIGITAQECFKKQGLDLQSYVKMVSLNNTPQIQQGITTGQLAGGLVTIVRYNDMNADSPGKYAVVCKGWEASPQLTDVFVVNKNWIGSHTNLAIAIAAAEMKAASWAKSDQAGWIALAMSKVDKLKKEAATADYQDLVTTMNEWPISGGLDESLCNDALAASFTYKAIKKQYKCSDLVTFDYQNAAKAVINGA